jgi:hypothetical protein
MILGGRTICEDGWDRGCLPCFAALTVRSGRIDQIFWGGYADLTSVGALNRRSRAMRKALGSAVLAMGLLMIVAATWGAGP